MAKKIKNMNKAELIKYAATMGIEVDRYMTMKQIIVAITIPKPPIVESEAKPEKTEPRIRPQRVMCKGCGRFLFNTETTICPDCHLHHCAQCAKPGTCVKCGLYLDPILRKLKKEQKEKNDNESKKQTI